MEDRQKDYGDYKENFRLISVIFNVILHDKLKDDIEPYEVGQLMMGLKLYRATRKYKADNYDDLEIYSKKQMKIARVAGNPNKIDAADLAQ